MRQRSVSFVCALLLSASLGLPARVEAKDLKPVDPRPELAGVTVVRGSTSGSIPVRLPERASVDVSQRTRRPTGPNAGVEIEGRGRFIGVVIVPDPYTPETYEGGAGLLMLGRFMECDRVGCAGRVINTTSSLDASRHSLEPGNYRLHLIADESPAKVKIRFSGLGGRVALSPSDTAAVDLQTPSSALVSDGKHLWAAGSAYRAGNVGISMTAMWVEAPELRNISFGVCQIQTLAAPPEAIYGPQCSALDQALGSGGLFLNQSYPDDEFILTALFSYHDQGGLGPVLSDEFGLGVWFLSPQEQIRAIGSTTFFVQLADSWAE